jgi:hypothetical protein
MAVGGIAASCGLAFLISADLQTGILYAGTSLDFFGLVLVAKGISDTRKQFLRPSVFGRVRQWFGLLADAFRGEEHQSSANVGARFELKNGGVNFKLSAAKDATIEQRVQLLEQNLDRLFEENRQTIDRNEVRFRKIEQDALGETEQRTAGEIRLSQQIEDLAVGDFHLEAIGIVWLLLGIIFTNIPAEVAKLIHFQL